MACYLTIDMLLAIMGQERLLAGNPLLERSIRNRFPYLDPLNHVQVEAIEGPPAQGGDEQVLRYSGHHQRTFRGPAQ